MAAPGSRGGTSTYQPALDGVRAVSVIAVLLFHAGLSWMTGGYLGVSVFFTLSGFLITRLLITEFDTTGRIAPGAFYARRARRLLPASAVCLVAVCIFAAAGAFDGVADLRRDVVGAGLQVANWTSLAGGGSYSELLADAAGRQSPLTHYWSLAIEEQFYWLWPIGFLALARLASRRGQAQRPRRLVWIVGALTALLAVSAPVIGAVWGPDAAYWATPARAAEILIGALLAAAIAAFPSLLRPRKVLAGMAAVCLAGIVVACMLAPSGSGSGPAYHGALPLFALMSGGLVWGVQVAGPVRAALSLAPLAWLGRISYGVYLYHWPVYVLLDAERTGIDSVGGLLTVRAAVTLGVAVVSFYVIEQPIRRGIPMPARLVGAGALAATAAVLAAAVVLVHPPDGDYFAVEARPVATLAAGATLAPLTLTPLPSTAVAPSSTIADAPPSARHLEGGTATTATGAPTTATATSAPPTSSTVLPTVIDPVVPPRPVRILVAGDSTAEATAAGLVLWSAAHPELAVVQVSAERGCGFVPGGDIWIADEWRPVDTRCQRWLDGGLADVAAGFRPDVVLLMTTSWDVIDRRWPDTGPQTPIDQGYRDHVALAVESLTGSFTADGVTKVAWVHQPIVYPYWNETTVQSDPSRHQVLYDEMDRVAAASPGLVSIVDLAGWVEAKGWGKDQAVRPDGVHWSPEASVELAEDWLGPQLIATAVGAPR